MDIKTIAIEDATSENVAGYGTLIDIEGRQATAALEDFSFYNELNVIDEGAPLAMGIVDAKPRALECTSFERHQQTTETLLPLDGDVVLAVAKPTKDAYPSPDEVRAFRVKQGQGITLDRGTWHYAPYVEGNKHVRTLVLFKRGTPENDLLLQDLEQDKGVKFELKS